VTDDVTCLQKVKVTTPLSMRPYILITAPDDAGSLIQVERNEKALKRI